MALHDDMCATPVRCIRTEEVGKSYHGGSHVTLLTTLVEPQLLQVESGAAPDMDY